MSLGKEFNRWFVQRVGVLRYVDVCCIFMSTVTAFLSRIAPRNFLPWKKKKKDPVTNYIMMVGFHLGFPLPQPVLAHLDGAETSLDH